MRGARESSVAIERCAQMLFIKRTRTCADNLTTRIARYSAREKIFSAGEILARPLEESGSLPRAKHIVFFSAWVVSSLLDMLLDSGF
jgi:hypothetical protein